MPTLYDFQSIRNVDILRFQQELEQRLKGQGLDDLERQIAKRPPYAADPVDLARMGQDIIKAIYEGTDPQPRLVYQLPPHTLKLGLCHRELQRLIGVRYIKENVYSHKKCDPSIDWPAGLQPEEPDRIPADDTGPFCELCNENQCGCIGSCYDSATGDVRIIFYGDKGFGLEAVLKAAATAVNCVSRIAFCKGDMIGELVGTLVPPDTCQDSRAMELVRGDLPEEPTVGQIFSGQATSIFYFVNHQCKHPNTAFEWKRISGRYRCQIVALRDIEGGEELTVFCGNDFMDKDKCLCADCI
ncbi:uncharacterized protein PpBr36_11079 [Pyricularia pennisetigena]|uniref:uncharacterized protein n=1 Tax=Pyricularia pennisetigena TaxID=1578925 RepID=UPI00114D8A88|nr:uncharacterized protein PpBr36_11079 [Pyricularia pennisetigena]TLS20603.1 hypothetical protein PpBr36_11079 [Pyricularia pennisetigena]